MSLRDRLRKFDQYRRRKMVWLEAWLYRVISNRKASLDELIPNHEVKRVLLVRNNKRIGNMYFLLPFLHQLFKIYPNAKIDLMLSEPWQGSVFKNFDINSIYYSNFSFHSILKWFKTMRDVNKEEYDLILAPYGSASDTIISALIKGKNKVSSYDSNRVHVFPNSKPCDSHYDHAAFSTLTTLESIGQSLHYPLNHRLIFSEAEESDGLKTSQGLRKEAGKMTLAFFRGARGKKRLPDSTWSAILDKFDLASQGNIQWVEILSPDVTQPLNESYLTYRTNDMRLLAVTLKHLDGLICCDTGPLHLADAAGARCIGLYSETDPKNFGVLGEDSINVADIDGLDAQVIYQQLQLKEA